VRAARLGLRARLTLWYVGVLAALLIAYTGVVAGLQYWALTRQIYHDQVQDMETVEGLLYVAPDGRLLLRDTYHTSQSDRQLVDRFMEVLAPTGEVLYRNDRTAGLDLGGPLTPNEGTGSFNPRRLRLATGEWVQLISHRHPVDGKTVVIRLAYSLRPASLGMLKLAGAVGLVLPLALAASALAGHALARRALRPLERMADATSQITAQSLHERLAVDTSDDELGRVARVVNDLLARLEMAFEQLTQFSSDVAHELRTPLAAIRSVGEVGLQQPRSADAYREIIGSMLEETGRLTELIDGLLLMSRAESGRHETEASTFPLVEAVREASTLVEILAQDRRVMLDLADDSIDAVRADRLVLRLAIVNVLHNAIKHSPEGGRITLRVTRGLEEREPVIRLEIEDEGPGVPAEERERVFQRFYRVDRSRSRDAGGIGLGLAIARWAVSRAGGTIAFEAPRHAGARCVIRLPVAGPYPDAA
jgi:heavy metal sensor kinase